jgi:uncharacterized protein YlaN (UPF0358 family)
MNDQHLSDILASVPDSTEVVLRDEDGDIIETGLNVGLLTVILARCHAYEEVRDDPEKLVELVREVVFNKRLLF